MSHCMLALYKCWNFPVYNTSVHDSWKEVPLRHFRTEIQAESHNKNLSKVQLSIFLNALFRKQQIIMHSVGNIKLDFKHLTL